MKPAPHKQETQLDLKILILPTVITLCGIALLLFLSLWQIERLKWKNGLIAERQASQVAPVLNLNAIEPHFELPNLLRVNVTGEYMHDDEFHLLSRTMRGKVGVHVITPFRLQTNGGVGLVVLINRGWVSENHRASEWRMDRKTSGIIEVAGIISTDLERSGWFMPKNDPSSDTWYHIDIEAMSAKIQSSLEPFVIQASDAVNPNLRPLAKQNYLTLSNNHLGYAITWLTLAIALFVIYLLFVYRAWKRYPA